ncbi:MAG TPA: guanylate kinase [Thermodesulfobacteriota bacterium]|nr:guanylate kinase [Thermodesulfobacteriota bacterium]
MRKGLIFVVSAPSGAGKTSLCKRVVDLFTDLRHSISYTTRAPRGSERDGVDYNFVSEGRFLEMIENDEFVEWAFVHGNRYGTAEDSLRRCEEEGIDVILDIDVQGAAQIRKKLKRGVYIFVLPPSQEDLEKRLRGRGTDGDEVIRARLSNAREEVRQISNYDYIVINDLFDDAAERLKSVIVAERCRRDAVFPQIKERWEF